MKRIVIADLHLTGRFDQPTNKFLIRIIKDADEVIINGDLWDEDLTDFDGFQSAWEPLLTQLAARRTVYIPGNHDAVPYLADKAWFAASVQQHYSFTDKGVRFHIEHGHRFDSPSLVRKYLPEPFLTPVARLNQLRTAIFTKLFPYTSFDGRGFARMEKRYAATIDADVVIFSHSHIPFSSQELLNTGAILYGVASWIEISAGVARLRKAQY